MSNEIIEAIITGLVIGIGMVIYRVYQYQTKIDDTLLQNTPDQPTGNGFRVAMETVKDSHATSVELLHEQIDHMQQHVKELEQQHTDKDTVINRLQELLLAQGIVTNDDGFVISYRAEVNEE
jgi:hypothetical protein